MVPHKDMTHRTLLELALNFVALIKMAAGPRVTLTPWWIV